MLSDLFPQLQSKYAELQSLESRVKQEIENQESHCKAVSEPVRKEFVELILSNRFLGDENFLRAYSTTAPAEIKYTQQLNLRTGRAGYTYTEGETFQAICVGDQIGSALVRQKPSGDFWYLTYYQPGSSFSGPIEILPGLFVYHKGGWDIGQTLVWADRGAGSAREVQREP